MIRALLAALLVSGCAAPSAYWVRVHEPVAHTKTIFTDAPCGSTRFNGCNSRSTGVIWIRRGMTEAETWCALAHEKRHLAGYDHPRAYPGPALDCGNGEML